MDGRMLLSHNFDLSTEAIPPLSREDFAAIFQQGLASHSPQIRCRLIQHPHWMVEIRFAMPVYSPAQVGTYCAEALAQHRRAQALAPDLNLDLLVLGGLKSTPPTSADPEALQPGEWGIDVVETPSAEAFLTVIAWESTLKQKPDAEVFKVECLAVLGRH